MLPHLKILFSSDKYETYHPAYPAKNNKGTIRNPGARMAVRLDEKDETLDIVGPSVKSVTLRDLTLVTPKTSTFIIKSDIQDFDCQVNFNSELQNTSNLSNCYFGKVLNMDNVFFETNFIPYIFVEWNSNLESCSNLYFKLKDIGYTPW